MNATFTSNDQSEMTAIEAAFARARANSNGKLNVPTASNKVHVAKVKVTPVQASKPVVVVPAFTINLDVIEDAAVTKAKDAVSAALEAIKNAELEFKAAERENVRIGMVLNGMKASIKTMIEVELPRVKGVENAFKLSIEQNMYKIERAMKETYGASASADVIKGACDMVVSKSPEFVGVINLGKEAQSAREATETKIDDARIVFATTKIDFDKSTDTMNIAKIAIQAAKDMLVKKEAALVKAQAKAAKKFTK